VNEKCVFGEVYTYIGLAGDPQLLLIAQLNNGKKYSELYNRDSFFNISMKLKYRKIVKEIYRDTEKTFVPFGSPPELIGRKHRT
jgi:hypothetical protein